MQHEKEKQNFTEDDRADGMWPNTWYGEWELHSSQDGVKRLYCHVTLYSNVAHMTVPLYLRMSVCPFHFVHSAKRAELSGN